MMSKKKMLKQEALLRKALQERQINCSRLSIRVDHMRGKNYINGLELGIIYPESFLRKAMRFHRLKKRNKFYFNGNMSKKGQRDRLFIPFEGMAGGKIIRSNLGRMAFLKSSFNFFYYIGLARSIYGLCPHQKNWPGPTADVWTYRFIECCLVKTMPILFDETPLGDNFVGGFFFVSDKEYIEGTLLENDLADKIEHNFRLACDRFFLNDKIVEKILT